MATLQRCTELLDRRHIHYTHTRHANAYRAREVAAAERVPSAKLAKTVIFLGDGCYAMAVLPADCRLDLDELAARLGLRHIRLATESEVVRLFPGTEVGAMPPLGELFALPVYLDERLTRHRHIVFNAGTHRDAIHMRLVDYVRLAQPVMCVVHIPKGVSEMPFASNILFPVDFSERSRAVRPCVIAMARRFGAKVTLLHVIQVPLDWYGGAEAPQVIFDVPAMTEDARGQLDAFLPASEPALAVEPVVLHGDAAACIAGYAGQYGIDLIMMPTHGYGKFRSLLLGSVTAKVLHDAKCAVWTSAHTEDPGLAGRAEFKNILCAVGLEPENSGVICYAARLARSFHAQLRLVHAVSLAETRPQGFLDTEVSQGMFQMTRDRIAERQKEAGTDVPVWLEAGSVSAVVRRAAEQCDADLLLIGRGRLQGAFGRLRTNAYAIIRDSSCPVMSV